MANANESQAQNPGFRGMCIPNVGMLEFVLEPIREVSRVRVASEVFELTGDAWQHDMAQAGHELVRHECDWGGWNLHLSLLLHQPLVAHLPRNSGAQFTGGELVNITDPLTDRQEDVAYRRIPLRPRYLRELVDAYPAPLLAICREWSKDYTAPEGLNLGQVFFGCWPPDTVEFTVQGWPEPVCDARGLLAAWATKIARWAKMT